MALPAGIQALIADAPYWDQHDRKFFLAVLADLAEPLPAAEALLIAQFLIAQLSLPADTGKVAVVEALTMVVRKFGRHRTFREFMKTYENEIGLCMIGSTDRRVIQAGQKALNSVPSPKDGGASSLVTASALPRVIL